MTDDYLISLAKTEYREGYNTGDIERILSVFNDDLTNWADGDASFYGAEGKQGLREQLQDLFAQYTAEMAVIIIDIGISGGTAFDWGWHKLSLTSKATGEVARTKYRYYETWKKQPGGSWKIDFLISNREHAPRMLRAQRGQTLLVAGADLLIDTPTQPIAKS
jgi:ketosteroid isomerase-like protein